MKNIMFIALILITTISFATSDYFHYEYDNDFDSQESSSTRASIIPDVNGVKVPETHLYKLPNEKIQLQDLTVKYENTDINIPGPNGFDLSLKRELGSIKLVGTVGFKQTKCGIPTAKNKVGVGIPLTDMTTVGFSSSSFLQAGTLLAFENGYILKCINGVPAVITNNGVTMIFGKTLMNSDNTERPLYVTTSIYDRFGNTITFNYGPDYTPPSSSIKSIWINSISRNDGANITFEYEEHNGRKYMTKAIYGDREVQYSYANESGQWKMKTFTDQEGNVTTYGYKNSCVGCPKINQVDFPNGLKVEYSYQSYLPDSGLFGELLDRTVSGPDVTTLVQSYNFNSHDNISHRLNIANRVNNVVISSRRMIIRNKSNSLPLSKKEKGIDNVIVGRVLSDKIYFAGELVYSVDNEWSAIRNGGFGCAPMYGFPAKQICARAILNKQTFNYKVDGGMDTYIVDPDVFDEYGNIIRDLKSIPNSNSVFRYTSQTYKNDLENWIIGLKEITKISDTGAIADFHESYRNVYWGSNSANKSKLQYQYEFGQLKKNYQEYHPNGDLKKLRTHNTNYYELYEQYNRGTPQKTTIPGKYNVSNIEIATRVVNDFGEVVSATNYDGIVTNYMYDKLSRQTKIDYNECPNVGSCTFQNDITAYNNQLRTITKTKGNFKEILTHDVLNRIKLRSVEDITVNTSRISTAYQYNDSGLLEKESLPVHNASPFSVSNARTEYEYDGLNRKIKESIFDSDRVVVQNINYLANNSINFTDGENNLTNVVYQTFGSPAYSKPIQINQSGLVNTSIGYNIFDNINSISQGGITENRIYNSNQQLCKVVRPDVGITGFGYTLGGLLSWQALGTTGSLSACGGETESDKVYFTYDNQNDLHKKEKQLGDCTSQSNYVDGCLIDSRDYGLSTHIDSGKVDNVLMFNNRYKVIYNSKDGANSGLSNITYNDMGNIFTEQSPDSYHNNSLTYTHNALGQVKSITETGDGVQKVTVSNINYHPSGELDSYTLGNGIIRTIIRKNSGLPESITDSKGGNILFKHTYSYDNETNLLSLTDGVDPSYNLTNIVYDGLNRIDTLTGHWGSSDFDYDSMNNITKMVLGGQVVNYVYDSASKRLTNLTGSATQSFVYDNAGNISNNGKRSFVYDRENRIINSHKVDYTYDYDGLLINKRKKGESLFSANAHNSIYNYNNNLVLSFDGENENLGVKSKYYYLNNQLIARVITDTGSREIVYQHTDSLGSLSAESDENGNIIKRYHYEPFGFALEDGQDDSPGYTGHIYDDDIGLNYMKARFYDPQIGRFYSNDPIGFEVNNPMTFNRYGYANNNPYKYIDITGKNVVLWIGGIGSGVIDFVSGEGFNKDNNLTGALLDGYDGSAGDIANAALEDITELVPIAKVGKIGKKLLGKSKGKCCFLAGTQVLTKNGYKNIEDVKLNELVWSKDVKTGNSDWKPVSKIFIENDRGIFNLTLKSADGDLINIQATDDHPFYTKDKVWKTTIELKTGDYIETKETGNVKVVSVIDENREDITYNFEIADFHTYYVTKYDVLVHNCPNSDNADIAPQKGKRAKQNDNASDQFEGIEMKQRKQRKKGDNVSIQSTKKSQQREKHQLKNIDIEKLDDR